MSFARLAAKLLRQRSAEEARVSARLQAGYLEELRATGLGIEVDRDLFRIERRQSRRTRPPSSRPSQRAAEAAVVEVVSQLAQADIRDGILCLDDQPLTSERLYARASLLLGRRASRART